MNNVIVFLLSGIGFWLTLTVNAQVPPVYEVYAVAFTNNFKLEGKWSATRNGPDTVDMCFMVWLIKGNNGKNILVDAGYILSDSALKVDQIGYTRPDKALKKMNLNPDDITDVIISHTHFDHIGGVGLFPKATVWMQKDDYDYFVGPTLKIEQYSGYDKDDVKKITAVNTQGRLRLVKGDNIEIIDGIRVFIGSRHTFESQYVQVTTGKEKIIIASDNIWFYHNLDNLVSIPMTLDTTGYIKQMKRMKLLTSDIKLIIPGHDAMIFSRFPKVADGVVRISGNK